MNALELMKDDHQKLKKLLDETLDAKGRDERSHLIEHVRSELVVHERMEEQVFYPALRTHPKAKDIVLEGYEEHHVADVLLDELLDLPEDSDQWCAKVKVLKENIEHHIEEEEGPMFKVARKVLDREELESLGEQMAAVKEASRG
jgi:hemerythrin-like domain-containing protein